MATGGGVFKTRASLDVAVLIVLAGAAATSASLIGAVFTGAVLDNLAFAGAFHGSTDSPEVITLAGLSLTSIHLTNGILTGPLSWLGISSAVMHKQPISMLQLVFRHCAHFTIFNHNVLMHVLCQEEACARRQPIGFLHSRVQLANQRGL